MALKNIILVSYSYAGSGANTLRYRCLSDYLVKHGYSVDVVGFFEKKETGKDINHYYQIKDAPFFLSLKLFFLFGIKCISELKDISFLSYIRRIGLSARTCAMIMALLKKGMYDICLVGILPWAYYTFIPFLSKFVKVVVDIGDPLYKNAMLPNSDCLSNFVLESTGMHDSSHIITMNEPTIPIIVDEMRIPKDKVSFIPPAMNVNSYRQGVKHHYPLNPSSIRLLYIGSLYKNYRDISAFSRALNCFPSMSLRVFTNSRYRISDNPRIEFNDAIPHGEALKEYQNCDIILFIDNSYGYQVPSKIFEVLAQNKPILFLYDERNTYLYNMLKNQTGIIFTKNEERFILDALTEIQTRNGLEVNYSIDLSLYSTDSINNQILTILRNLSN